MIENEIWKVYSDKRGNSNGCLWEVSNLGRVRKNGFIIENPGELNSGYLACGYKTIHRMVAELFIPNPENKPCIDHIDDNKHNNRVDNLRWVTYSENNGKPSHVEKQIKTQTGRHFSEEATKNIGDAVRKWWSEKEHHSDETRKRMSEIRTEWWANHVIDEEEHARRSASQKGKYVSEETRKKQSEKRRGENHPLYGKHHSEETKAKMRIARLGKEPANKGTHLSDEQKKRQHDKMQGRKRVYHDDGTWHMTKK